MTPTSLLVAFVLLLLSLLQVALSLHPYAIQQPLDRRQALAIWLGGVTGCSVIGAAIALADDNNNNKAVVIPYELRDRRSNNDAVIREDYWYMTGRIPPRNLQESQLSRDDPQWNAFGSCVTNAEGSATNSCTYVSLRQRVPAYSKYAYNIALGAKEYQQLGDFLRQQQQQQLEQNDENKIPSWSLEALSYLESTSSSSSSSAPPTPTRDAILKMILLGSGLLTSPNFSGPNRELLVSRFYVNEVRFALTELSNALRQADLSRAVKAWEFGRDNWNSYFLIVNRQISAKVGDKFQKIV